MNMKDRIRQLANERGMSIPKLEDELGFGRSTIARWNVASPTVSKAQEVADFFGVTVDYLLGREDTKKELPELTPKDERELAKQLEAIMNNMDANTGFAAVGGTVDDEHDRELLRASLEMTLRLSKQIAKKKFTPKKHRK